MECIVCGIDCSDTTKEGYHFGFGPQCFKGIKGALALSVEGQEAIKNGSIQFTSETHFLAKKFFENLDKNSKTKIDDIDKMFKKKNHKEAFDFFEKNKSFVILLFKAETIREKAKELNLKDKEDMMRYLTYEHSIQSIGKALSLIALRGDTSTIKTKKIFNLIFKKGVIKLF